MKQNFKKSEFTLEKNQIALQYITRKEKLNGKYARVRDLEIFIKCERFKFWYSEKMPLTGVKYIFKNNNTKNIVIFW